MKRTPTGKRAVTIEDLLDLRWVGEPQVSPTGSHAVYVQKEIDSERDTYRSHLWLVALDDDSCSPRQLTSGEHRDVLPRWSPDGRFIAFLSDRPRNQPPSGSIPTRQLYVLPVSGGEARLLETVGCDPEDLAMSPDGNLIAFTGRVRTSPGRGKLGSRDGVVRVASRFRYRSDGDGFWDGSYRHIFVVPIAGGAAVRLTEGDFDHREPAWSPDGRWIAFVANRTPDADLTDGTDLWIVPAAGGQFRCLTRSVGPCTAPSWSPDGEAIAYLGHNNACGPATNTNLWVAMLDGSPPQNLSVALDRTLAYHLNTDMRELQPRVGRPAWSADGKRIFVLIADGGTHRIGVVDRGGGTGFATAQRHEIFGYSVDQAGTAAVVAIADAVTPGDLWLCRVGTHHWETTRRLTAVNPLLDQVVLSRPQLFRFTGAEGWPVEGWVLLPQNVPAGSTHPAVLQVHGGPHSAYGETFCHEWQVLAVQRIGVATNVLAR